MLDYKEFMQELKEETEKRIGCGAAVCIQAVEKVNLGAVDALAILPGGGRSKAGPVFYLPPLFREYRDGRGMESIVEGIAGKCLGEDAMEAAAAGSAGLLRGYMRCRDRLYFRLLNTEKNRGLLEKAPHMEILDLSMVCYALMGDAGDAADGMVSTMVTDSLAEYWGTPPDEILAQAACNAPKILPVKIRDIFSVLKEAGMAGDTEMPRGEEGKPCFHVLSNSRGIDGFSAILYPGALKGFADAQGKDLYVLPCSRHEALLLPDDGSTGVNELRCMVRSVNDAEVAEEDILSYHVYFYDRAENKLMIAGEEGQCVRL